MDACRSRTVCWWPVTSPSPSTSFPFCRLILSTLCLLNEFQLWVCVALVDRRPIQRLSRGVNHHDVTMPVVPSPRLPTNPDLPFAGCVGAIQSRVYWFDEIWL